MSDSCDVVVVGAGPVGATAALLLAAQGVKCIVVEPRKQPGTHPAAHVLSTRSMEIWREIGLERDIRRLGAPMYEMRCITYCTTLAGPELGRVPLADLPEAQTEAVESVTPTRTTHLPQSTLEPLLWQHVRDSAHIDLRTGWRYSSHTDDADGVAVTINDTAGDSKRTIKGRYLIAADGAASTVRRALRIAMEGPVLQHMVSVHFSADLEKFRRNRRGPVILTHSSKGLGVLIIHRSPQDLVFQIPYFPPVESLDDFPVAVCRDHIRAAIGDDSVDVEVRSIQKWAMHAQVATDYRVNRAFLAGDAAHRFPPTGGLGLNTGIADVHNLAWKLAWVISGRADADLLETYAAERRPVGRAATDDSVANLEGLFEVIDALGLPKQAVRLLPQTVAALPHWLPRRPTRAVIRGVTSLGYKQFDLASSSGPIGRRMRRRVAATMDGQSRHYRSWGRDLGVIYRRGALLADGLPLRESDPEFYTPSARAGGRLPHAWVDDGGARVSTLDLVRRDQLTLFVATDGQAEYRDAAAQFPMSVVAVDKTGHDVFCTGVAGADADGLVVRPDGHIAAVLTSDQRDTASMRQALQAVSASPGSEGSTE